MDGFRRCVALLNKGWICYSFCGCPPQIWLSPELPIGSFRAVMDCRKKRSETAMLVESPISMICTGLWSINGRVLTALGYRLG